MMQWPGGAVHIFTIFSVNSVQGKGKRRGVRRIHVSLLGSARGDGWGGGERLDKENLWKGFCSIATACEVIIMSCEKIQVYPYLCCVVVITVCICHFIFVLI